MFHNILHKFGKFNCSKRKNSILSETCCSSCSARYTLLILTIPFGLNGKLVSVQRNLVLLTLNSIYLSSLQANADCYKVSGSEFRELNFFGLPNWKFEKLGDPLDEIVTIIQRHNATSFYGVIRETCCQDVGCFIYFVLFLCRDRMLKWRGKPKTMTFNWQKLSPDEFHQLQEYISCK